MSSKAWVIAFPDGSYQDYVRDGHGRPCTFDTEREAMLDIASHVLELIHAFRKRDTGDFECAECPVEVEVDPDGTIRLDQGVIWPKD